MIKYSVIIPVYNRPDEMAEMLDSLQAQNRNDIEIVLIEDGSQEKSDHLLSQYELDIKYFFKPNTGPGDSRNFGMSKASGSYLLFFDSDCVLPTSYFERLDEGLLREKPDAFGGPDAAHESFSDTQKAINYAMTSFFTTGGIRGGKKQLDKYQPRSFNMGMTQEVYKNIGGFSDIHPGEDPDLSFRIMNANYKVSLLPEVYVYHKRRIDLKKFMLQVYKFGIVRIILNKWYPKTKKLVYFFPSLFLIGLLSSIVLSLIASKMFLTPVILLIFLLFIDALVKGNSIKVSLLAIPAAFIQLTSYGYGFLKSFFNINIIRKEERKAFPNLFFGKK